MSKHQTVTQCYPLLPQKHRHLRVDHQLQITPTTYSENRKFAGIWKSVGFPFGKWLVNQWFSNCRCIATPRNNLGVAKDHPIKIGLWLYIYIYLMYPIYNSYTNQLFHQYAGRLGPPTVCKTTFSSRVASVTQNDIICHSIKIQDCIFRLVPPLGTTYHGGGWGGMLTFMWTCRSSWLGEVLKAVRDLKLPWRDKNQNWSHMFLGEVFKHRVHVHTNADDDDDDDVMIMMMMMMMMTLMKLVNSGTKFRPGIDKFYQPNSGCEQFQEVGRGYIYISYKNHIHIIL